MDVLRMGDLGQYAYWPADTHWLDDSKEEFVYSSCAGSVDGDDSPVHDFDRAEAKRCFQVLTNEHVC